MVVVITNNQCNRNHRGMDHNNHRERVAGDKTASIPVLPRCAAGASLRKDARLAHAVKCRNTPRAAAKRPKRRYVYMWQCCACGCSRINIMATTCPECGVPRCAYCHTTKVKLR
ncbi:hypothetical protein V8E51_019544 [Hyaloscypha variabilis]